MNVDVPNLLRALGITEFKEHRGELWARCPFPGHKDADASWSICWKPGGPRNGYNHCFGCKEEGGPLKLIMAMRDLDSLSAARDFIKEHGLDLGGAAPLAVELVVRRAHKSSGIPIPFGVKIRPLSEWPSPARRYAERRGLTPEQVNDWGIGYGSAGALVGRLWIPSRDRKGRLRNWNARSFSGRDPRYMQPLTGEGADQGAVFGEQRWPADPSQETVVLCEGEFNALACERAGAAYIAALSGSNVDPRQLLKVSRFGRVVIGTDVDKAGTRAALEVQAAMVRWRGVERLDFPEGKDACDVWEEDPDALEKLIRAVC